MFDLCLVQVFKHYVSMHYLIPMSCSQIKLKMPLCEVLHALIIFSLYRLRGFCYSSLVSFISIKQDESCPCCHHPSSLLYCVHHSGFSWQFTLISGKVTECWTFAGIRVSRKKGQQNTCRNAPRSKVALSMVVQNAAGLSSSEPRWEQSIMFSHTAVMWCVIEQSHPTMLSWCSDVRCDWTISPAYAELVCYAHYSKTVTTTTW